jgi:site-specific DNA-methyltransferase (adenine-specific)
MADEWVNQLYFGDNLDVLRRHIADGSVDLIYLDPPFNSKATYNVLFKERDGTESAAQITAFEDFWRWDLGAEWTYEEVVKADGKVADLLSALLQFLGRNDMMAYITMMAIRLKELHRVLKPTGSLYLHCDPTASHYIKLLLDAVFGPANLRNEIIWRRTGANKATRRFGPIHQVVFLYGKTPRVAFSQVTAPYTTGYIRDYFREADERGPYRPVLLTGPGVRHGQSGLPWRGCDPTRAGRHWQPGSYLYSKYTELTGDRLSAYPLLERLDRLDDVGLIHWRKSGGGTPNYKFYLADAAGAPLQDIWAYQPGTGGCVYGRPKECIDQEVKWLSTRDRERLNFPTQKPEGLLARIVAASSREGDVVLDPFCGCGTTIAVAERLHRRWIGIDITHLAIALIRGRLAHTFGPDLNPYRVVGEPTDLESARALSRQNRHQFEYWALGLVDARPAGTPKKGADKGIDGVIRFFDDDSGKAKRVVISVKSGHVNRSVVHELKGVMEREKAEVGALITLEEPTRPMREEATEAGFYDPPGLLPAVPRVQILTIEDLLAGKKLDLPVANMATFQKAPRQQKAKRRKPPPPDPDQAANGL